MKKSFQEARDAAWRLATNMLGEWDDPMTDWALSQCSEISGLINQSHSRAARRWEQETGWTIENLLDECEARCTSRWAYFSPLQFLTSLL